MRRSEKQTLVLRRRRRSRLKSSLENNLASYALAAGMAGVGVLALASPVQGEIVFTATHRLLRPNSMLRLDLNGDGIDDFYFVNFNFKTNVSYPGSSGEFSVEGSKFGNEVIVTSPSQPAFAQALNSGAEIGSNAVFGTVRDSLLQCGLNPVNHFRFRSGPWINVQNKFVGLKFTIQGATHFGWARFTMEQRKTYCRTFAVLTGYAYETVANKPIVTGITSDSAEPTSPDVSLPSQHYPAIVPLPTLNSLALGAPGLWIWRKEEREQLGQPRVEV